MPEMVVPKPSHDRICLKKSSPNGRSTITISESALTVLILWKLIEFQEPPNLRKTIWRKSVTASAQVVIFVVSEISVLRIGFRKVLHPTIN